MHATLSRRLHFEALEDRRLLDAAPLLYYKNDAITSSTSVADSSSNSFNGTLAGTYGSSYNSTSGEFNGALLLNQNGASDGYVTLPGGFATALQSMTNFTISGWVYLTTRSSVNWERLFDFGTGTSKYMFLTPVDSSGYVRFAITTSGNGAEQRLTSTTTLPTNTWTFLAVTLSGTTATLYVNGYVAATNGNTTLNPSSLGATTQDYLGKSQFSDPKLKGGIDDFRVYNTALSAPTVLSIYNAGAAQLVAGTTTLATIGTNGYYAYDTNSCAIAVNNLWTDAASNYQFAAYYTTVSEIMIARRQVSASSWQVFDSGISDSSVSDDHDVIAIAVDSAGYMHMSWGMHNISLLYAISNAPVTGASLGSISFTQQTASNAPTLFPNSGADTNEVTYPQFYAIPNSSNLLFTYRNGGSGGGSGNGNQYFDIYNPGAKTFSHSFVINGELTSVNAYLNRMVFDSNNNLLMTWTWRATSNWQTNSNIMFAQSPDVGATWYKQGGTTQYTLPIIQSGTPATSVAQVVETIPQNSSFINQTCMTVDNSNNPLVVTYLAPNSGDPNRQYVLYYYSARQWRSTQITHRTSDTAVDTSGNDVRDLGRPLVLVDKQGRVLVIGRSEDTAMGSYAATTTPNNNLVVYYCTNLSSGNPTWNSLTLNTTDMGSYEPTYDQNLWKSQNILSLFFEPVGLAGQGSGPVQTLDWNEQAYFAPTVATAAAALPAPVTGTSTALSVLGAANTGEANLTYTWTCTGPASVRFSGNGTNRAKNVTATFSQPGNYSFLVTIADTVGQSTTSSVAVLVNQTPTVIVQSGPPAANGSATFMAISGDQFGNVVASQPTVTWAQSGNGDSLTVSGPGLVSLSGPSGENVGNTTVTSGELIIQNAAALADGGNLTVGDPSLFAAPVVASALVVPASGGNSVAATPASGLAAGLSPSVVASPPFRLEPALPTPALVVPASAGRPSVFRPNSAMRAAAAVLARQNLPASNHVAAAAVDALFAKYAQR